MEDGDRTKTRLTDAGKSRQSDREVQRAEALRANLLRRKTQARGRAETGEAVADKPRDG